MFASNTATMNQFNNTLKTPAAHLNTLKIDILFIKNLNE